jgi:heat shock protein HslJ
MPSLTRPLRVVSVFALGIAALIFSACQSTSVLTWPVTGTVWNLVELEGQMVGGEKIPTLQLEPAGTGTRINGFSGLNRFGGGYTLNGDQLTLGLTFTTRMAGPPKEMEIEARVYQLLASVTSYEIKGPWMALKAGDKVVIRAQALPAQPFPPK